MCVSLPRSLSLVQDDKKILVWEWNTNVPIKWIAEPTMFAMPTVTLHPSGKFWAAQSMDNTIPVYGVYNNFRQTKRTFSGHTTAGYACQIGFSPNGRFTMSGDGSGRLWFWDWKTTRVFRCGAHTHMQLEVLCQAERVCFTHPLVLLLHWCVCVCVCVYVRAGS